MNLSINSVKASGLKGSGFQYDLVPFTIFCGNNFVGKSRVMDAIRLCLLGHLPELGKTSAATFDLASEAAMTVDLEIADGLYQINRRWAQNGKSITATSNIGVPDTIMASLPISLNIADYFAKTPGQRLEYLFGAVAGDGPFDNAKIIVGIKNIALPTGGNTKETEAVLQQCRDTLAQLEGFSAVEFFPRAVDHFKAALKTANDNLKRMTGTVQGLAQLQAMEQQLAALDHATIQSRLSLARKAGTEASSMLATLTERQRAAARELESQRAAREFITTHKDFSEGEFKALVARCESADTKADQASESLRSALAARDTLRNSYSKQKIECERTGDVLKFARSELDAVKGLTCCPTCDAKTKGWRDKVETEKKKEVDEAVTRESAAKAELQKLEVEGKKAAEAATVAQTAHTAAANDARTLSNSLRTMADIRAKLEAYRGAAAAEAGTDDVTPQQIEKARLDVTEKQDAITKLIAKSEEATRLQQDIKRTAQAQSELATAVAQSNIYKAVVELIDTERTKLITEAVQSVLAPANEIVAKVMPPLEYEEGNFGYRATSGRFVKSSTFSGAQQAVAFAGISLGLAGKGELRVGMVDELARLHAKNLPAFFSAVASVLKSGRLGQFIGVLPMDAADVQKLLKAAKVKDAAVIEIQ